MTPVAPYHASYNLSFVVLSVVLSTLSAYVAVELASRVTSINGRYRMRWLFGGAACMGIGIWSMHYVGMLAFLLPVPVTYHVPTVLLSLLAAVLASLVALTVVSRRRLGTVTSGCASLAMGGGIAAMHYIGMAAMRLPASCHWSSGLVSVSIILAVAISMVALFLIFELRDDKPNKAVKKGAGILLMGAAIPLMHYTGMAAAEFWPRPAQPVPPHCVSVTFLGTFAICFGALLVLSLALIGTIFDRKFSDQNRKLESSERRHRQLVESVQAILWQKELHGGTFTLVNSVAERWLGYPLEEWRSDPLFLENHSVAADKPLVAAHCSELSAGAGSAEFEHRMISADNRILWLRTYMRAIVSPDGTREIASVMHDITKKKILQRDLQQQRQYFNALMDSAPDHIYFKDLNSRFILINKATASLFKLARPEDAIGLGDGDFFEEPHVSNALAAEREIMRTGQGIQNVEEEENWPDGSVTWASTTKMPLYGEDGRISGTMGVSRNITKRKLAEVAILEKTKLLTELNADLKREMDGRRTLESQLLQAQKLESIGQLAAGVAHELNTPIQYVADNCRFLDDSFRGLNEMLRQYGSLLVEVKAGRPAQEAVAAIEELAATLDLAFLSSEVPNAIEQSIDGIDRVAQIVRAMKEFSHPGSREKAPVDLNHGIENTLVVCRNEYKYLAQLETDFTLDLPPVYCLAGEINQAVLNLIVNASHAIKDAHPDGGGIIRVSTHLDGEFVEIRVWDNGTGIPEAIQNRIFEPFFTTKEVGKGSGQGLALARNVAVHKHNGSLTFETQENEGTTFILRIPVGPEPQLRDEIETDRTGLVELSG